MTSFDYWFEQLNTVKSAHVAIYRFSELLGIILDPINIIISHKKITLNVVITIILLILIMY